MSNNRSEVILLLCWLSLILATLATVYWGTRQTTLILQLAVIVPIALFKSSVIIDGFMELRHAGLRWRLIMYGWPLAMSMVMVVTLLAASAG